MRPHSEQRRQVTFGATVLGLASFARTAFADEQREAMVEVQHLFEQGHIAQAESLLQGLARDGQVQAMERLAMLHWYGPVLYPGGPWRPEVAYTWFERAAAQGSNLSRHMLPVVQRTRLVQR